MNWINPFARSKNKRCLTSRCDGDTRRNVFERLEQRILFDAAPIWVGGVYIESDEGSDFHGDDFYISFNGGSANTQLTRLVINTDQDATGMSRGDNLFDTAEFDSSGHTTLGADHAFGFQIQQLNARNPNARVTASVADGSMQLILTFENFYAGDVLVFSIDVDEVQIFDPASQGNVDLINPGLDPITSGVEFQGSTFQAFFQAPNYQDIQGQSIFMNRYDPLLSSSQLPLPADNDNGLRDRSTGTAFSVVQIPKPISLAGTVYVDNNINLVRDPNEQVLSGVTLELYRKEGSQYISTGYRTTTNSLGQYEFGLSLNLQPGTYQVRETQPAGYFSVGATPGLLTTPSTSTTSRVGQMEIGNRDILTEITVPLGDQRVTELDFAEALPTKVSGYVYVDADDDGIRDSNETGISGVQVRIEPTVTILPSQPQTLFTNADGYYEFLQLIPGTYRVIEVAQPVDYFDGKDTAGQVGSVTRGQVVVNDRIDEIVLNGADVGTEYNFGELPPSSLSGHVCMSLPGFDCFSTLPNSKTPLVGVKIELANQSGQIVATAYTDSQGEYHFEKLPSGLYAIIETTPDNVIDGGAKAGIIDGTVNGTVQGSSKITSVDLRAGRDGIEYDFCELPPATLSGHVYEDINNDGVLQSTEPRLADVLVQLFDSQGNKVSEQRTDSSGSYRFSMLSPGVYRIVETTPQGYIDGKDAAGTILGVVVGTADSASDTISQISLPKGRDGIDYDFGEIRLGSIRGTVYVDSSGDRSPQSPEPKIGGVLIDLIDSDGHIIRSTTTASDGSYQFDSLPPGQYAVREHQPSAYFDGPDVIGSGGGTNPINDFLKEIVITSGHDLIGYDFIEVPPSTISGYVYQDGPVLVTADGKRPDNLRPFRDGQRTSDDTPLAGVRMELRQITGAPFLSKDTLAGSYTTDSVWVLTDENGYFEFTGLRDAIYHVYQRQPVDYVDGLDTPGTLGGFSVNAEDALNDPHAQFVLSNLETDGATNPDHNAILLIDLGAGQNSRLNNFSEVLIQAAPIEPPPPLPPSPVPPITPSTPPLAPPPLNGYASPPFQRMIVAVPPPPPLQPDVIAGGITAEYTWHLSIINAGTPRGAIAGKILSKQRMLRAASLLNIQTWAIDETNTDLWTYVSKDTNSIGSLRRQAFDIEGATPLAGDFNGDGQDELSLFLKGEWLIDINGNGQWDKSDMWAMLGDIDDRPVVGDWDGDGKDDIGIFGPEWLGDERAIQAEPGLPDPENHHIAKPKNLPPQFDEVADEERLLQRSILGPGRADVIDHVFRFGIKDDQPVAGDFNGDGISSVGIFRDGKWRLDVNGDGFFSEQYDHYFDFGKPGDIAIVGDFDGDSIDEVGVVRGRDVIIDSNRNRKLEATDRVFELQGLASDQSEKTIASALHDIVIAIGDVVVGDFDGDGADEVALIRRTLGQPDALEARSK